MEKVVTISLCMIVKNEEQTLKKCLDSVKAYMNEMIIVDTGSTDRTKEIAQSCGAKVIDFKWQNDFGLARNFAFSQATSTYIMWLDGDDFISEESQIRLKNIIDQLDETIDYISAEYVLGRDMEGEKTFVLRRNRIVRRERYFRWIGKVHEYLEVYGKGLAGDFEVEHGKVKTHTDRNLEIFQEMEKNQMKFTPRDLYYYANELRDNGYYTKAIKKYKAFINTKAGWGEDVKGAYAGLIKCYKKIESKNQIVTTALEAMAYDIPKAEICCELGNYYVEKLLYKQAAFWYKMAFQCKPEEGSLGMDDRSYYTWVPSLQLCICYFNMGKLDCAYFFNELAASFSETLPAIAYNRNYFTNEYAIRSLVLPTVELPIQVGDYVKYL